MKFYYSPGVYSLSPHIVLSPDIVARDAGIPLELVKVYDSATDGRAGASKRAPSLSFHPARSCSAKGA